EGPVEREIEDSINVLQAASRYLLPRDRRGRQEQAETRIAALEICGERARRESLADRYRVYPDRLLAVHVERNGKVPQPLPEAADVFSVTERLIYEVRGNDHEEGQRQEAVEEIHRSIKCRKNRRLAIRKYSRTV